MSDAPVDYVAAALALELWRWGNYDRMPLDNAEFSVVLDGAFGLKLNADDIEKVIGRLAQLQFIAVDDDRYIGRTINTSKWTLEYRFGRVARQANVFGRAKANGKEWLRRVFKSEPFIEELRESPVSQPTEKVESEEVTQDSLITILRHSEEGKALEAGLTAIEDDLQTNNEVAEEAGEDRERLLSEVKASRVVLWSERLRVDVLRTVVLKFLKDVGSKFSGKAAEWGVSHMIEIVENLIKEFN